MLTRLLQPLPFSGASRRAYYSVFSSKPGGGRYFNSAKPHKVSAPAAPNAKSQGDEAATTSTPSPSNPVLTQPDEAPVKTSLSQETQQPSSKPELEKDPPRLPPHPSFSAQTYPLHQFFALHRPLLLLPLPTASLFIPPEQLSSVVTTPLQDQSESESIGHGQDEADTARQIVRAMAIHRVGPMIEWTETLASLGDRESIEMLRAQTEVRMQEIMKEAEAEADGVQLDSTKRKRRRKMSKHKLKKRRKATRSQRRKLGK